MEGKPKKKKRTKKKVPQKQVRGVNVDQQHSNFDVQ
jgi:hypothetical protein